MPEISLNKLYSNIQAEMLAKLGAGAAATGHSVTKGDASETDWIQWLRNYLPQRYKVGKGIVIDYTGKQSEQIDIIIYDAQYTYFVFHHENTILVPVESVYAVFEVKQNLKKEHIEYAGAKAQSVRKLIRSSAPIKHAGGTYPPKALHEILAGLLTTNSEWVVNNIHDHVAENIYKLEHSKHLDFVCSVSDSTFVIDNNVFVEEYEEGRKASIKYSDKSESLVFLLLNLLQKLQDIGTVPAIEFSKYGKALNVCLYEKA